MSKLSKLTEAQRKAISAEVLKMLALGVIEKSNSKWSDPMVLMPKPETTQIYRFVAYSMS